MPPLLTSLFKSDFFKSSRGKRIKSPVEYVLGAYRRLGIEPERYDYIRWDAGSMGQRLTTHQVCVDGARALAGLILKIPGTPTLDWWPWVADAG